MFDQTVEIHPGVAIDQCRGELRGCFARLVSVDDDDIARLCEIETMPRAEDIRVRFLVEILADAENLGGIDDAFRSEPCQCVQNGLGEQLAAVPVVEFQITGRCEISYTSSLPSAPCSGRLWLRA